MKISMNSLLIPKASQHRYENKNDRIKCTKKKLENVLYIIRGADTRFAYPHILLLMFVCNLME